MLNFSTTIEQFSEQLSLEALGLDLNARTVAIVTAFNEMSVSNSGLDKVADEVKKGILSCDFNAITFNLPNVCNDLTIGTEANKFVLPMRDVIADLIETYASLNNIDGFVFVANDASTVAGMLMGALRSDTPSLFIGSGTMQTAVIGDKKMGFYAGYESSGLLKNGQITLADLEKIQKDLIKGCGNASDSYCANSSLIIAETLGLALPRASTMPSNHPDREKLAFDTGVTITHMIKNVMTPSDIVSEESIKTAVCVDLALGSSSTSIINLLAIANEAGHKLTYDQIAEWKNGIPRLVHISTRKQCFMEDFDETGGVYIVIKKLIRRGDCDGIYTIFDGITMREHTEQISFKQNNVIKNINDKKKNPLCILKGNLAQDGAIGFLHDVDKFVGKAKVFDSSESALEAISAKQIVSGDVVVIRNEGPVSGPGMREVFLPISMLVGLDLDKEVAIVTDGRVPDISRGIVVGNLSKETADPKSLLCLLQNGDEIEIDLIAETINAKLTQKEISSRKKHICKNNKNTIKLLQKYAMTVSPAQDGCYTSKK